MLHNRYVLTVRQKADPYLDKGFKVFVFVHEVLVDVDGFVVTAAEFPINFFHTVTIGFRELRVKYNKNKYAKHILTA